MLLSRPLKVKSINNWLSHCVCKCVSLLRWYLSYPLTSLHRQSMHARVHVCVCPDQAPIILIKTLWHSAVSTVFVHWIKHTHTRARAQSFNDLNGTSNIPRPNLTRNEWACTCICTRVHANPGIYTHLTACWGRPTPSSPSFPHFNTAVTGAGPKDNGAPPKLAASSPWRGLCKCSRMRGKYRKRPFIPPSFA